MNEYEIPDSLKLHPDEWNFLDADGKARVAYNLNSKEFCYDVMDDWKEEPVRFVVEILAGCRRGRKEFYYYSDAKAFLSACLASGECAVLRKNKGEYNGN